MEATLRKILLLIVISLFLTSCDNDGVSKKVYDEIKKDSQTEAQNSLVDETNEDVDEVIENEDITTLPDDKLEYNDDASIISVDDTETPDEYEPVNDEPILEVDEEEIADIDPSVEDIFYHYNKSKNTLKAGLNVQKEDGTIVIFDKTAPFTRKEISENGQNYVDLETEFSTSSLPDINISITLRFNARQNLNLPWSGTLGENGHRARVFKNGNQIGKLTGSVTMLEYKRPTQKEAMMTLYGGVFNLVLKSEPNASSSLWYHFDSKTQKLEAKVSINTGSDTIILSKAEPFIREEGNNSTLISIPFCSDEYSEEIGCTNAKIQLDVELRLDWAGWSLPWEGDLGESGNSAELYSSNTIQSGYLSGTVAIPDDGYRKPSNNDQGMLILEGEQLLYIKH